MSASDDPFNVVDLNPMPSQCNTCNYSLLNCENITTTTPEKIANQWCKSLISIPLHRCHSAEDFICAGVIETKRLSSLSKSELVVLSQNKILNLMNKK